MIMIMKMMIIALILCCKQEAIDEVNRRSFGSHAKYGHCDVSKHGDNGSLGKWCSELRVAYKKIQNNQKPRTKLSNEQIQRLSDAGFKWSLRKAGSGFDKRFNDLMSFKATYGHCDVSKHGEPRMLLLGNGVVN